MASVPGLCILSSFTLNGFDFCVVNSLYMFRQSFIIFAYEYQPENVITFALNRVLSRF